MGNKLFSSIKQRWATTGIIILLFVVISFAYFPALLEGKEMIAHDLQTYAGMSKEIDDHKAKTGEQTLWTNSMFGGMPGYFITSRFKGNFFENLNIATGSFPRPAIYLILSFALFFVLLRLLKVKPWIAFGGALLYGFNSFFFIIMQAGHMTKANTLLYMSVLVAGVLLAYNRKHLQGAILAALGLAMMIAANHPQMTYYAGIMVVIIAITYFIFAIKEKVLPAFFKASALLLLAAVLAVAANFGRLYTTLEYSKYSMRGPSDLTPANDNKTSGLDKDYILTYSYDWGEAMTAFIPRFKGGGMSEPLTEKSEVYKILAQTNGAAQARQTIKAVPLYWGSQPISNAPFYYGAVLCFLFVLGLFLVKGKEKWWVLAVFIVSFLLSLGKNIPWLAHFMVDYFPGYNKFRDVKNIIVIQNFSMALLGVLALKEVYQKTINRKSFLNGLKYAFAITGGLAFVFILFPGLAGNFSGNSDAQLAQYWPQQLIDALMNDRESVLRADAFRTLIFVSLSAAGIWAYYAGKLKANLAIVLFVGLIFADMWPVNKKYFNNSHFASKQKALQPFPKTQADQYILTDNDPHYRVLNMGRTVSTFNDASTSFYHKSIGGYHGAKMQRYQEMIEYHITKDMQRIGQRFQTFNPEDGLETVFVGLNAINMLNTKYLIYSADAAPLNNPAALGNAWFVSNVMKVNSPDEEILAIEQFNPATTAIVEKRHWPQIEGKQFTSDSTAQISLKSYTPNKLVYSSNTNNEQLAVFSDIYYPAGWVASINGEEYQHFGVNYILRGMIVPAGNHEIIFEFKPQSYEIGNKVSLASSILLLLLTAGLVWFEWKNKSKTAKNEA